ncbi:hypothetical protein P7K49_022752 [Saguinus oedipus]|uniref:ERCC4 domain-containing protein n=1 Tax=Saguinus oedipus TaxID=9490 RepID=A0ABQ9UJR0_SAGOE|nr:hypothetical protein P7K49_022752 [Saguinus oedipus]
MARVGPGRAGASRRGRSGQQRPATWEISDSDTEGPAHPEAAARAPDPAGERRAAAEALRLLRPEQVLRRLAVRRSARAVLGEGKAFSSRRDSPSDGALRALRALGPDLLPNSPARAPSPGGSDFTPLPRSQPSWKTPALEALGCECLIEPQRPARSLQWTRASPDPCPRSVSAPTRLFSVLEQSLGGLASTFPVAGADVAMGWPEVEEALVLLQLWANLDVLLVASWEELSQHVCAITKALAQCPLKQYQESQAFSFCTAGRWAAGEPVARDGTGLQGAWWRQIRQFSRVSPAVADAVVTAFPSPRLLQQVGPSLLAALQVEAPSPGKSSHAFVCPQALVACRTERERLGLLADLPVRASEDGRPRRVGPDLSRRICLFLTTANPDLLLDLSS